MVSTRFYPFCIHKFHILTSKHVETLVVEVVINGYFSVTTFNQKQKRILVEFKFRFLKEN